MVMMTVARVIVIVVAVASVSLTNNVLSTAVAAFTTSEIVDMVPS